MSDKRGEERLDDFVCTGFDEGYSSVEQAFHRTASAKERKRETGRILDVCAEGEIPEGKCIVVQDGRRSIGVFFIEGDYYAIVNRCPHEAAPLCEGHIQTTHAPSEAGCFTPALKGRVLRCPWHAWEFDVPTGQGLHDSKSRVRTFEVEVSQGRVLVKV